MFLQLDYQRLFQAKAGEADTGAAGGNAAAEIKSSGLFDDDVDKAKTADVDSTPPDEESDETGAESSDAGVEPDESAATDDESAAGDESPDDDLLDRALDLGLTSADILHFRSNKTLEAELTRLEKDAARIERLEARRREKQAETKAAETQEELDEIETEIAALLASGYDERNLGLFKKLNAKLNAKLKSVEAENTKLRDAYEYDQERKATEARERAFDRVVIKLDTELFGEGDPDEITETQLKNRSEVWERANALEQRFHQRKQKPPALEKLIREAHAAAFAGRTQEMARKKLKDDLRTSGGQTLSRSRSQHKPATGIAAALQKTSAFLSKYDS